MQILRWEFIKENKKTRTWPRKRSTKQERKQELDQESDQEKLKKNIFSWSLSWSISCFVSFFLVFSCFLSFLFSFINSHLCFTWWKCNFYMNPHVVCRSVGFLVGQLDVWSVGQLVVCFFLKRKGSYTFLLLVYNIYST